MTTRDGFSVMEALAATALLAVAMLPIYDMLSALHRASELMERATQAPFIDATALVLLNGPAQRDAPRTESGTLLVDGWSVEWRRRPLSETQTAGAPYGFELVDIWLEELELILSVDGYRQTSVHRRLAWSPRHDSLEAYLLTLALE